MKIIENIKNENTNSLKVLFLLPDPEGSAVYVRAFNLAKHLVLRGHDVTLMAVSNDSRFKTRERCESGLRIIETPNFLHNIFGGFTRRLFLESGTGILDIIARIRECRSGNYDIIQLFDHSLNVAVPFYLLRRRLKSRFVSDWCDIHHFPGGQRYCYGFRLDRIYGKLAFPLRIFSRFIEFDLRRKADGVTAISRKLLDFAVRHGVGREKVFLVEGGADIDNIIPLAKAGSRKKLGLPQEGKIIGFMGTFQRDMDIVIESFALLKKEVPDSYLLVIGRPFPWAGKIAEEMGLAGRYIEAGRCPHELLPDYLASTDVLVLPFKDNLFNQTRWPNKIGEYMACGRPVVISNVGDIAEIVRENAIGLVAGNTADDFSAKLEKVLSNPVLAENMGKRARHLACNKYSWALQSAKLEGFYHYLLDGDGNADMRKVTSFSSRGPHP